MLHNIVETKREEVRQLKAATSAQALLERTKHVSSPRGFRQALVNSSRKISVIAEVKKASPSKGIIREPFHPLEIAADYANASAEAISVLTDQRYFQGSLEYLKQIRETVPQPLLRKDFIIDEIQVVEARAWGADCILLIAAILDGPQLAHFSQAAASLGMDVLIEVHDKAELEKVLSHTEPQLIGINNRNLKTFQTDITTTAQLIHSVPAGIAVVSESGISKADDIVYLQQLGVRSVLVGEHFMRQADIPQAVLNLVGERVPEARR
jgi:indole-3-glycerol phosphate synthase